MRLVVALLACAACRREVPVLLYHEVGCGTHDERDVPAEQLDRELTYLEAHGYRLVRLEDAVDPSRPLPDRAVAVSFDDGAACLYSAAFPVLARHRAPFELFLVSGWIGSGPAQRTVQPLEDGERVPNLVWPEVRTMRASGLASIGAHGRTHLHLGHASAEQLDLELAGSRDDLAAQSGEAVPLFAYPYGAFDLSAVRAARRAGYAGAFSVGNGPGGRYAYRRRSVHRGASEADFEALLRPRWIFPLLNHD